MDMKAKQTLQTFVDSLKLEYRAEFIPTPQPADKVKHPQLHWRIHLNRGKRGMSVEYHEGCAHVKGYQQFYKSSYDKRQHDELIRLTCETGKFYRRMSDTFGPIARVENGKTKMQPAPELLDVLYCLVQDSDVLDRGTFEEWASEFGYDLDSRSAEKTYRLCLEQSLQLRNLLGNDTLEQLRELYQDY